MTMDNQEFYRTRRGFIWRILVGIVCILMVIGLILLHLFPVWVGLIPILVLIYSTIYTIVCFVLWGKQVKMLRQMQIVKMGLDKALHM